MAKNRIDPRQIWGAQVAPLVTAAREGASHAAQTARRERARVVGQRSSPWWKQRWVMVTAGGLVVAGAAGGVWAALSRRSARRERDGDTESGIRSTMEAGRAKVAGAARTVMDRIRSEGPDGNGAWDSGSPPIESSTQRVQAQPPRT